MPYSALFAFKRTCACLIPALLVVFFLALPATSAVRPGTAAETPSVPAAFSPGEIAFSLSMYNELAQNKAGNFFFSPWSVRQALSMVEAGAAGETAAQLRDVLGLTGGDGGGDCADRNSSVFTEANGLWYDLRTGVGSLQIEPAYTARIREAFCGVIDPAPFSEDPERARVLINEWVSQATADKISELLQPGNIDPMTRLMLVNAILFKGSWMSPFDPGMTRSMPFHPEQGEDVDVPMMVQPDLPLKYLQGETFSTVALPFSEGAYEMVFFLPRQGVALAQTEETVAGLSPKGIDELLNSLSRREATLFLPRFTMRSRFNLIPNMQALGIRLAFDPNRADLSGIAGERDLFVDAVVHEAVIEVDEKGAEAAAATGVGIRAMAIMDPLEIRLDRPFMYLIRRVRGGEILFMGRYAAPPTE